MAASELTLGRDFLGLSFWRGAFKTNITEIPVDFKPEL